MKKTCALICCLIFCIQCLLAGTTEREFYLANIEIALQAHRFDQQFDSVNHPHLRAQVKEIFLQIYAEEKAHPQYIQCVTAQDSLFYAYQVIAKQVYRKFHAQPKETFEFLRFPTQDLSKTKQELFLRYPLLAYSKQELSHLFRTTPDHLENALKEHELRCEDEHLKIAMGEKALQDEENRALALFQRCNDTIPEISKELLSVNFSMETYCPLDSAMWVFLSGRSVSLAATSADDDAFDQKLNEILCELFVGLSLPPQKVKDCVTHLINKAPRTKLGIINQIFLSKSKAAQMLYFSFGGGVFHPIYNAAFEESLDEFQKSRQTGSFRNFRNFQARIIAGALFQDPGLKILRYTLIPEEQQRQYEALVREAIDELAEC